MSYLESIITNQTYIMLTCYSLTFETKLHTLPNIYIHRPKLWRSSHSLVRRTHVVVHRERNRYRGLRVSRKR